MQKSKSALSLTTFIPAARVVGAIARRVGFVKRKPRKIQPRDLVIAVLICICEATPHLRGIAENLGSFSGASPSRQAVFGWLRKKTAPLFFMGVLQHILGDQAKRVCQSHSGLRKWCGANGGLFKRVLIEDGSVIPLHKSLAKVFEGSGNQHGKNASLRMRWNFDLLTGEAVDASLHHGLDNDMSTANDILGDLRPRDLLIRDMGYFCLDCFHKIIEAEAFFITRIPAGTKVFRPDGEELDIYKTLRNTGEEAIDLAVKVGCEGAVSGRLVGVELGPVKTGERKRRLREQRKAEGKTPTKKELFMCSWVVVFTNVEKEDVDAVGIATLYRTRWMIEVFFKGVKSGQAMGDWAEHRTNAHTAEAFCYAHMIIGILGLNLWRVMGAMVNGQDEKGDESPAPPSTPGAKAPRPRTVGLLKAMDSLIPFFADLFRGIHTPRSAHDELSRLATYAIQEKRKRKTSDQLLIDVLA